MLRTRLLAAGFIAWAALTMPSCTPEPEERRQAGVACHESDQLVLELEESLSLPESVPPRSIDVIDGRPFFVSADGALASHPGLPEWLTPTSAQQGVTNGRGVMSYSDNLALRLRANRDGWDTLRFDPPLAEVRAIHVSDDGVDIWVISGRPETLAVRRYRQIHDSTFGEKGHWPVPGSWRLVSDLPAAGEALLVSAKPPLQIVVLGSGGVAPLDPPTTDVTSMFSRDSAAVVVAGAAALDCRGALVTLADLRSTERQMLLVDADRGTILRSSRLSEPMSFFRTDPMARRAYAYRQNGSGGEVLTYRWRWQRSE